MRKLVSMLFCPALLGGGVALALVGLARGLAPVGVAIAVSLGAAALIVLMERLLPYRKDWNRAQGDVGVDILHTLVTTPPVPILARVLLFGGIAAASVRLSHVLGATPWPSRWPLLAQLPLALLVAELGQYWVHRLAHETRALWRLHALHHSVGRLHWLNTTRFHPLDTLLQFVGETAPLVLLGASDQLIVLYGVFTAINGGLRHANVAMRFGPLSYLLSTANLHRWHHSRVLEEANANYGANLIVWDLVFGTRRAPDREGPEALGLADLPDFPTDYVGQLASPFRRALWRH